MKFAASFFRVLTLLLTMGVIGEAAQARNFHEPTSAVPYARALHEARAMAAGKSGMWIMRVEGTSMLPFFGPDSVLVVKKVRSAQLRVGMIAVYVNRFGETVAHRVIAREEGGWRVQGYNNDRADSTLVDAQNLKGVVYATLYASGRPAGSLASAVNLSRLPVALAAPAR